jgi:hypothetical protein
VGVPSGSGAGLRGFCAPCFWAWVPLEVQVIVGLLFEEESKILTTEEELEGFRIVVAILRRKLSTNRIYYRDTQSYFGILLDDNNRKPLCRLHFNTANKYLGVFDEFKKERKISLLEVDDIYNSEEELLKTVDSYLSNE